jgi:hypothetical protein
MKLEVKVGDVFEGWTVESVADKRGVNEYYHCLCECGTKRQVFRGSLLGGRSKSCGCRKLGGTK